jgi:hypothetical protein
MLRLIGILTGSAIAVAFLIVTLGPPRLAPPADAVEAVEAVAEETELPAAAVMAPVELESLQEIHVSPLAEPVDATPEIPLTDAETEALIEEIFSPQPQPVTAEVPAADTTVADENWYAFWSPFRSEIAANGFIAKLQETTGIDYRVVKVKTGVYEVAFAYIDDADIQNKLARISNATGLDMTGG